MTSNIILCLIFFTFHFSLFTFFCIFAPGFNSKKVTIMFYWQRLNEVVGGKK